MYDINYVAYSPPPVLPCRFLPAGDTKLESLYNISLGFGINITF